MPAAEAGFFPLDRQLELWDKRWSEGVVRDTVWLSGIVPYEQAAAILERIGGVHISKASTWRRAQEWGAKLRELSEVEREKATALPEKWEPPSRREVPDQRMGMAMDGTMMNIVGEGWKELKLGVVFDVAVKPKRDEGTGDMEELGHAANCSYVAHLGGPDILGEMAWAEARRRMWEEAQDTMVIGDGAPWIWKQAGMHFGYSQQLVDWYHAKQHLVIAAQVLKGDNENAYQRWLNSRETMLFQGHAERIADELCAAALTYPDRAVDLLREAGYFRQNKRRMQYLEMREEGWPIGSGMVESGAKQYKDRFCGAGMRWGRSGAKNLLPVRTAIMSRRYDYLWECVYNSPPN